MSDQGNIGITAIDPGNIDHFKSFLCEEPAPLSEAAGVILDGEPAGAAVFDIEDETGILQYIFIGEEFRRKGCASEIIRSGLCSLSLLRCLREKLKVLKDTQTLIPGSKKQGI